MNDALVVDALTGRHSWRPYTGHQNPPKGWRPCLAFLL